MNRSSTIGVAILLCCSPALALDWKGEVATSPSYLLVTGSKPEEEGKTYTKPTGKFKTLADDVISRVTAADPKVLPQAWTVTKTGSKKRPGLVIVFPVTHDLRIDDVGCYICPNSLFSMQGHGT